MTKTQNIFFILFHIVGIGLLAGSWFVEDQVEEALMVVIAFVFFLSADNISIDSKLDRLLEKCK